MATSGDRRDDRQEERRQRVDHHRQRARPGPAARAASPRPPPARERPHHDDPDRRRRRPRRTPCSPTRPAGAGAPAPGCATAPTSSTVTATTSRSAVLMPHLPIHCDERDADRRGDQAAEHQHDEQRPLIAGGGSLLTHATGVVSPRNTFCATCSSQANETRLSTSTSVHHDRPDRAGELHRARHDHELAPEAGERAARRSTAMHADEERRGGERHRARHPAERGDAARARDVRDRARRTGRASPCRSRGRGCAARRRATP